MFICNGNAVIHPVVVIVKLHPEAGGFPWIEYTPLPALYSKVNPGGKPGESIDTPVAPPPIVNKIGSIVELWHTDWVVPPDPATSVIVAIGRTSSVKLKVAGIIPQPPWVLMV